MPQPPHRRASAAVTVACALGVALALPAPVAAQVATDGSLGRAVALDGPRALIGDDLGRRAGPNLFHSFARFGVDPGGLAAFAVPDGVTRVVGRVTGGQPSSVAGVVATTDPGFRAPRIADLWLFNPNGVVLGPGGRFLNGGAVHLSAGDALQFGDGATFHADTARPLKLSAAPPEAFGFLDRSPGTVRVTGVEDRVFGGDFSLSGGAVVVEDGALLFERPATIVLAAGARGDTAPVAAAALAPRFGPRPAPRPRGGSVTIAAGSPRPGSAAPERTTVISVGPGAVRLQAATVTLDGGAVLSRGGASVDVLAERLVVSDGGSLGTLAAGATDAGDLTIDAGDVMVVRGGGIRSQTLGAGRAGDVTVRGFDRLVVDRDGVAAETAIETEVAFGATGDAGDVRVSGEALSLLDAGRIFSATFGAGDAGDVRVDVRELDAQAGGQIGAGARDNPGLGPATGAGGSVRVTAAESASFSGVRRDSPAGEPEPSGLFTGTEGAASGTGGALFLSAPLIVLSDEAEIGAETFNANDAGAVSIDGGRLRMSGGAEITTTSRGAGAAGAVTVRLSEAATLSDGAEIASRGGGDGPAGALFVSAVALTVESGAEVTTDSAAVDGGAIRLAVTGVTLLDGAVVTTSVQSSDGDGGAIDTGSGPLVLRDGAVIRANAVDGDGGRVTVANSVFFAEPSATVEANSQTGEDGAVLILGAVGVFSAETRPPPVEFFNAFAVVDDFCVAAVTGGSALTVQGPEGAPFDAATTPSLFGGVVALPGAAPAAAVSAAPSTATTLFPRDPCAGF